VSAGEIRVEFGLLGPLLVRREAEEIPVPAARQRVLLAAMLFRANQVVPADALAEALWDVAQPATAQVTLRNYVKRLRHTLGDKDRSRVATRSGGYLIHVAPGELDLARFEALRRQAGECARAGRWAEASAMLHAGLSLWRGQPLADVPSEVLARREGPRLAELRLQATEDHIDADLHLGRHGELIAGLRQLTEAEPLRERLHELLMLALYRACRPADALETYSQARRTLVSELGIEPGPRLRDLHQRILAGDPALAAPPETAVLAGPSPVPRQLPAGVPHFVGRAEEIERLGALAGEATGVAGTVVISAIDGTAGVGKTALAVHWAHQVAGRFPDGQLYVNLRGFDPSGTPAAPGEAVRGFLAALGVPAERVPAELDAQAGLYRSLLAGKKILIMADNARDEQQVRPMLPASPGCLVLVTSRRRLAGLAAAEGARVITLDVLAEAEASDLLARRLGCGRVAAEPGPAGELIGLCARLPLALTVIAARAQARPGLPLAALAAELHDEQCGLDALDAGDPATSVKAAFSWSYRQLTPAAAGMFRLLGLAPGADITAHAAASLAGVPLQRARGLLTELTQAHLLTEHVADRYTFHDLLRAYAAELAQLHDPQPGRHTALTRLFDYYLAAAATAVDALFPAEKHRRPQVPVPARPAAPVPAPAAARDWLDTERATLVALTAYAGTAGWPAHATRLAAVLFRYLEIGGHFDDAQAIYTHALDAARATGDRGAQADALRGLGSADSWRCRYRQAADHHRQALALFRELGDKPGQARVLNNLGVVSYRQGGYDAAARYYQQALAVYSEVGDRFGQALAMGNLGLILCRQGRLDDAASHNREAAVIYRELGYREGEAEVLSDLGEVLYRQGHYQQAAGHLQQAIDLGRELGYRQTEAAGLESLARVLQEQGRYQQAADHQRQALDLFRELGNRSGEGRVLNDLGDTMLAAGQPNEALAEYCQALTVASESGNPHQEADAHDGLARICHAADELVQARNHWEQALAIYTDLGVPEASQIRARLDELGLPPAQDTRSSPSRTTHARTL